MKFASSATFLFVLVACFGWVSSIGIFQLNVTRFENPWNKDEQGICCGANDTSNDSFMPASNATCPADNGTVAECRTFYRVCVTHVPRLLSYFAAFRRRLDPNTPCSFGLLLTDIQPGSSLKPESFIEKNFTFDFAWPGRFFIIFEAWHSPNGTDVPGEGGRLIMRYVEERRLKVGDTWVHRDHQPEGGNGHRVGFSVRVICAQNSTGADCQEKCPLKGEEGKSPFNCTDTGLKICNKGWMGINCEIPICSKGCHQDHGYCETPGECQCRLGWTGGNCEECVPMPGCQYGSCNKTFECICTRGWDGFFCSQPICKDGCHPTRGYCEAPGECQCRYGWQGPLCESCKTLPGCVHGYCNKPLDCLCEEGWTGIFCNVPLCKKDCHPQNGYCQKPDECRCRVGWQGKECGECFPYPGCQNGTCFKPWECNCSPGWTGMLCETKIELCGNNGPCPEGMTCVNEMCVCPPGRICANASPEERD